MVGGGHDLVLSLGLGDGNARTRGLKRHCLKKDGKINKNNVVLVKISNCSEISLTISGTNIKVKILPSVNVLRDFNFKYVDWPDRLNKAGSDIYVLKVELNSWTMKNKLIHSY